jgi:hypothetical protein
VRYYLCKTSGLVDGSACYACYQKQRAFLAKLISYGTDCPDFHLSRPLCQKSQVESPECFSLKFVMGSSTCLACDSKMRLRCEALFMETAAAPELAQEKKEEAAKPARVPNLP